MPMTFTIIYETALMYEIAGIAQIRHRGKYGHDPRKKQSAIKNEAEIPPHI
jgi:hypothetical protein